MALGKHIALLLLLMLQSATLLGAAPSRSAPSSSHLHLPPVDPASRLYARMAGLVVPHGYPLEEHFVETIDGYILRLFRIPHGRSKCPQQHDKHQEPPQQHLLHHRLDLQPQADSQAAAPHQTLWHRRLLQAIIPSWRSQQSQAVPYRHAAHEDDDAPTSQPLIHRSQPCSATRHAEASKPVVHIQHGLLGSSTDFVLNGPENSLPMMLADAGFDVWFGNVRGNVFSRNHTTLDLWDAEFWQFSWDEMAARDLPAMLTYELMVTGASKLSYIGHSQGTTIGMAFLASHAGSKLVERIQVAMLLAPVAFVTHMASFPLATLATLDTDEVFTLMGFHEFMPSSEILSKLEGQMCKLQPYLCVNLLSAICGYNPDNLDVSRLPIYLNYTPSGTSVKNMAQWSQAVRQKVPDAMHYFDYGPTCRTVLELPRPCNKVVYGQEETPTYNLSHIRTPLVLFTGGQDILADPSDTNLLLGQLPNIMVHHHEPAYGHLDFVWGYNAGYRVYAHVLGLLQGMQASWFCCPALISKKTVN